MLSEAQISKLLRGIYRGTINVNSLPLPVYRATFDHLMSGVYEGYGFDTKTAKGQKLIKLLDLRENISLFSGAKTYQQTKEMTSMLRDEDGVIKPFSTFKNEVMEVYDRYNVNWLEAEYRTTIGQAQMAEQWQNIEATKDVLPYLQFSTDGHPCPECAPFDGLTAPVDSKIWNKCTPLLHFNCFCLLIQTDDKSLLSTPEFIKQLAPDIEAIPPTFAHNVGKTGEIFTMEHPYFKDAPKKLRESNFNLPLLK